MSGLAVLEFLTPNSRVLHCYAINLRYALVVDYNCGMWDVRIRIAQHRPI